ncbi:hypothetical protein K501DRAFT_273269 [Backusella circina FSU 941]|nr:hypothetical protein K501DRAFT_276762 [Backusella circina FSU 941]KAI8882798.1 hypothetical protein K501DRAFT_273269 [Backusella circina FSU 941]
MNELPVEALVNIFNHLHLKQKLECMLVCHHWSRVLLAGNYIFETVGLLSLPSSDSLNRRVNELIRRVNQGENNAGRTCKRLLYENKSGDICVDTADLARTFSNLKFLFFGSEAVREMAYRQDPIDSFAFTTEQLDSFQGWRNGLETVVDWSYNGLFFLPFLGTGAFNRLTSLALRFWNFAISNDSLFKRLKYAPSLTTLIISVSELSATDLEELHNNTPKLASLSLQGILTFNSDQIKSLNITPIKHLKVFKTLALSRFYDPNGFLLYIAKKYTCLDELELFPPAGIHGVIRLTDDEPNSLAWNELFTVIGPSLQTCTIGLGHSINNMTNALLQHVPNLKTLNLKLYNHSALCKFDLTHPFFLCLRSLSLFQITSTAQLGKLKELEGLMDLTLNYGENLNGDPIMLDNLINVLSKNIQSLCLTGTTLTIGENRETQRQQSNIVHLKLSRVVMDESVTEFIEQYFQTLKSLDLYLYQGFDKLELSNHCLSFVHIHPYSQTLSISGGGNNEAFKLLQTKTNTHLQLTRSNQTCYYKVPILDSCVVKPLDTPFLNVHDHSIQHALKPCLFNKELKYFQFNCASVQSIYFCGYLVL